MMQVENHLSKNTKRWFAVYTKYKAEKFVATQLEKKGVEVYVPLLSKTKKYERKIKNYQVPLINCYVFVRIKEEEYIKVLRSEYVLKFLKQGKNLISIPEAEMDILKRVVGEIENVKLEAIEFCEGQEVEIINGNLTGIKGKILELRNSNELVIELLSIGFQLKITVDRSNLIPVNEYCSI